MTEGTRDVDEVLSCLITLSTRFKAGAVKALSESTELTGKVGEVDIVVFG